MSDYTPITDFSAKDALTTGDPEKIILGSDMDAELIAIQTAVATKYDSADIASQAEAEAGTSNTVLMTPGRATQWAAAGLGGAEIPDGNLSANVPLLNASNTFTQTNTMGTINSTGQFKSTAFVGFKSEHASASEYQWNITGAATDTKIWAFRCDVDDWGLWTRTDADVLSTAALRVFRSGTTPTEFEVNCTAVDINGTMDVSGTLTTVAVTATGTITSSASTAVLVTHASVAEWAQRVTGAGTNEKNWAMRADTDDLGLVTRDDALVLGTYAWRAFRVGTSITEFEVNATTLDFNGNLDLSGTVTSPNTSASEVGYRGMPINQQSGATYTLVLSDAGKVVSMEIGTGSQTLTVPTNASVAFPIGTVIRVWANATSGVTITSSDTLHLAGSGYLTTGPFTLAHGGVATLEKRTSTGWFVSGAGLS